MALVPNGRMRKQVNQSLLRNGLFAFAQAQPNQQQNANQQPKTDPRLEIEQENIGNGGQPAGQQDQQAAPAPSQGAPEGTPGETPAANMDVVQDQVDGQSQDAQQAGETPANGGVDSAKSGLVKFTKEMAQKVMGCPLRKLEQMGGFVTFNSDAQHNDKVDLKFPNWYWGRPELGEVSKEHKMQIIQEAQQSFNLFYEGSKGDDDTFTMSFSTVDPRMGMETAHDARLKRTYKALAQPGGKPGAGQAKAASTMGEMIRGRRDDLFNIMRKIAQGSK